ncbi:MAG: LON peptidase substrate-binding domain-containing protein [Dehalococcoidia bacterium]
MNDPSETRYLRLFPLQSVVLYPGMELPLVVFEPRYLQLTKECTESDEPFGVLLLREGHEVGEVELNPYEVGTTAHIIEVTPMGENRLQVTAVGGMRFRIRSFDRSQPYLGAEVEMLRDEPLDIVDPALVGNIKEGANAFIRKLMAIRGGFVRDVPFPSDPSTLSYHIAQLFQGNPEVQQSLLEQPVLDRLKEERDLIKSAMQRLAERERGEGPGHRFSAN